MSSPRWLVNKVNEKLADVEREISQARAIIPEKYWDFLVLLSQNEKIANKPCEIDNSLKELGVYSIDSGVYIGVKKPYVTVSGRLKMLCDEHEAASKKFFIHPPVFMDIKGTATLSVTIESELHGSATGIIEIGTSKKGNNIAKAQTSAIGRALGYLGYGLVGTGIGLSLVEITELSNDDSQSQPPQQLKQQPTEDFLLRINSHPNLLEDSSVLFEQVTKNEGTTAKLWFPPNNSEFGMTLVPGSVIRLFGLYDPNFNCINTVEIIELLKNA